MNYLIGTSMQWGYRACLAICLFSLTSCLHLFFDPDNVIIELEVENDTDKVVEIIGFPNWMAQGNAFKDTVRIVPTALFNFRGRAIYESPNLYDSVQIFWGDKYQRTDFSSDQDPPPSFYSVWDISSCGKECDRFKLKVSALLPEVVNE